MRKMGFGLLVAALTLVSGAASAKNELVILTEDQLLNAAQVEMSGNFNRLEIVQEHTGGPGSNVIEASIDGDNNGGPAGSEFSGAALSLGLTPGRLVQTGFNNRMSIDVVGSNNLFAFSQNGSGNSVTASIQGLGNQAAVVQQGINNYAGFSQNGIGNIISIMQKSW